MFSYTRPVTSVLVAVFALQPAGCSAPESASSQGWSGTIDTLASGGVLVHNTGEPAWSPENAWQVVEEMRIGSDAGDDAVFFGNVRDFDVGAQGQVYVLDGQAQEIHVFNPDGMRTRSIGSKGTGPGEFEQVHALDVGADGQLWVMEMQHGKLTFMDGDGNYVRSERIASTGWSYFPYPGGMDKQGRYHAAVIVTEDDESDLWLARFDQSFVPIDTIRIPASAQPEEYFELVRESGGVTRTNVPFQGSFSWRFSPGGNFWTLQTEKYELSEVGANGETLRRITLDHDPIAVTDADREQARENLSWFTRQGGTIDWSRIPGTKPIVTGFFCDDEGHLWVMREVPEDEAESQPIDLFGSDGRFLGAFRLPFSLRANPEPVVRDGLLYGVSTDALGSETIVRARILKP